MPEMLARVLPRLTRLSETVVDNHQTRYRISPPPAERAVETDPDQNGGSKVGIDQRDAGPRHQHRIAKNIANNPDEA